MRIDEFEFQDMNGNEINPTKNQLVIYIKSLHSQIKALKEEQKQLAVSELEKLLGLIKKEEFPTISNGWFIKTTKLVDYIDDKIKELKGEK